MKKRYYILISFLLIIILGVPLYFVDFGFLSNRISVYSVYCSPWELEELGEEGCSWFPSEHIFRYIADKKIQTVKEYGCSYHWYRLFPSCAPRRYYNPYSDCKITDRKNWECSFKQEGSDKFGFNNGKYYVIDTSDTTDPYETDRYVSKYDYLLYKIKYDNYSFLKDPFSFIYIPLRKILPMFTKASYSLTNEVLVNEDYLNYPARITPRAGTFGGYYSPKSFKELELDITEHDSRECCEKNINVYIDRENNIFWVNTYHIDEYGENDHWYGPFRLKSSN